MTGLLSINSNLPLVQIWNKNPVPFLVMQMLCLPFDLLSDAPPFLRAGMFVNFSLVEVGMPIDTCMHTKVTQTCKTMTAGFELAAVAQPGMLFPKVTLANEETAVISEEQCSARLLCQTVATMLPTQHCTLPNGLGVAMHQTRLRAPVL